MVDLKVVFGKLQESNIDFFTGVPDSLLNDFCTYIDDNVDCYHHVLAANEGNAISIAAGYHLATGKIPMVYMQNSGTGNSVNPLISLTHKNVFDIPMILLIGWRGDPDIHDWPQHKKQGEATLPILDLLDIPYKVLEDNTDMVLDNIKWASEEAIKESKVVALVAKKNVFSKKEKAITELNPNIVFTRHQAISTVIDALPENAIYIASTGRITRELYFIRKEKNQNHLNDFLNVGAMGHTLSIALGIALVKKDHLVVCLDGDAAAIMHLGSLAIAAQKKPNNLIHIILNNGVHESVGGQKSIGHNIDLNQAAKSFGYYTLDKPVENNNDLQLALKQIKDINGIRMLDVRVAPGMLKKLPPLDFDHIEVKRSFMNKLIKNEKE